LLVLARTFSGWRPLAALTLSLILAPVVIFVARRLFRRDPLPFIVLLFTFIGALNLFYMYPRLQEYAALLLAAGIAAQMYRIASSRTELVARLGQTYLAPIWRITSL